MNSKEIKELIEFLIEKDVTEFELERGDVKMRIKRGQEVHMVQAPIAPVMAAPVAAALPMAQVPQAASASAPAAPGSSAAPPAPADEGLHMVKSPIVGTFYRSPSPTADAFVKIGSNVETDTVVCIIEAMKLMNEIQAETSGEVVKIYVENGQPVEYGQPLFGIRS